MAVVDVDHVLAAYSGDPAELRPALDHLLERPRWQDQAACRGRGPTWWFPERGDSVDDAIAICQGCPVRVECLTAQLAAAPPGAGTDQGIWGGLSGRQRRLLRHLPPAEMIAQADALRATAARRRPAGAA